MAKARVWAGCGLRSSEEAASALPSKGLKLCGGTDGPRPGTLRRRRGAAGLSGPVSFLYARELHFRERVNLEAVSDCDFIE